MDKVAYEAGAEQAFVDAGVIDFEKKAIGGAQIEPLLARLKSLLQSARGPGRQALTLGGRIPLAAGAAGAGALGAGGLHALAGSGPGETAGGAAAGGLLGALLARAPK